MCLKADLEIANNVVTCDTKESFSGNQADKFLLYLEEVGLLLLSFKPQCATHK